MNISYELFLSIVGFGEMNNSLQNVCIYVLGNMELF